MFSIKDAYFLDDKSLKIEFNGEVTTDFVRCSVAFWTKNIVWNFDRSFLIINGSPDFKYDIDYKNFMIPQFAKWKQMMYSNPIINHELYIYVTISYAIIGFNLLPDNTLRFI